MKTLDKYKKSREKHNIITTGVNITKEQKKFLQENDINLSRLVRDTIESLMPAKKSKIQKNF